MHSLISEQVAFVKLKDTLASVARRKDNLLKLQIKIKWRFVPPAHRRQK
jgi:hypothetical protein